MTPEPREGPAYPIPSDALVVLIGASGSGKSTYAGRHFPPEAVLSSDAYRARVSGNAADQSASEEAFRLLHADADARLVQGLLTVVDATNVTFDAREPLLAMALSHGRPAVALVLDAPLVTCLERNASRPGRAVPAHAVRRQHRQLRRAMGRLMGEGFGVVHRLTPGHEGEWMEG